MYKLIDIPSPNSALQHLNDLVMVNENQKDPKKVMGEANLIKRQEEWRKKAG